MDTLQINASVGQKIRFYRQKAGMTQKALAENCGLSEPAIRNYELGNRIPDYDTLNLIANELRISFFALSDPQLSSLFGAMHALFELEKIYGLIPKVEDGEVRLVLRNSIKDEDFKRAFLSGDIDPGILLAQTLRVWSKVSQAHESGAISDADYQTWMSKYPAFSNDVRFSEKMAVDPLLPEEAPIRPKGKRKRKPKKNKAPSGAQPQDR